MMDSVRENLADIEKNNNCKVLYACESGSRAWGFASPDSDYDVRFVYVHPVDWYFNLQPQPDTIDIMAPGDLDIGGWELSKMLRLFSTCNLALNEWFDSPIVYAEIPEFAAQVRELIPQWFNPKKAVHHYRSIALNSLGDLSSDKPIRIKKLFYVLRPLLACKWIIDRKTMPPMTFQKLTTQEIAPGILSEMMQLWEKKLVSAESDEIMLPSALFGWVRQMLETINSSFEGLPTANRDAQNQDDLSSIMKQWVRLAG